MASGQFPSFGVLAQELTESEATRRVVLTAGGLLLLGLALLIGTVWWWRATRPEHPALGPLEVMGERRWSRADTETRRSLLDAQRSPAVAVPDSAVASGGTAGLADVAVAGATRRSEPELVDLSVLVAAGPPRPDDLAEIDRLLGLERDADEAGVVAGEADAPPEEAAEVAAVEVGESDLDGDEESADEVETFAGVDLGNVDDAVGDDASVIDPLLQRARD